MSVERSELNVERSAPQGAVFLSYAREDTDAARRIAEALRSSGIEAWFDQAELRGGDTWDAKLRTQIRTCTLFLPVISATTQARQEGYFRREWKLAVERTQDMAAGTTFIVPVVIDDTAEAQAIVPEEFMRVQWTRLPGALPTPPFVAQVKRQLEGGKAPEPWRLRPGERDQGVASPLRQPSSRPKSALWLAILLGAFIGVAIYWATRAPGPGPTALPKPEPVAKAAPAAPAAISSQSVAVLAFANLSDDKGSEYFSDGISEELLNVLAKVPGLKVSARTSAFYFKGKNVPIPDIAKQLGVAYVVEGSVQRAGERVKITAQLIKAADGFHVWSDTYTRDMKDIFAVQDEIAGKIASSLTDKLGMTLPASAKTTPEAYTLYLQARASLAKRGVGKLQEAAQQFESVVALDPNYLPARSGLAITLALIPAWSRSIALGENEKSLEVARREARLVIERDPGNAEAWSALGYIYGIYDWRWAEAGEAVARSLALAPNDAEIVNFAGDHYRIVLAGPQVVETEKRAVELNPLQSINHSDLNFCYLALRQYELAIAPARTAISLAPQLVENYDGLFRAYGHLKRFEEMRAALAAARRVAPPKSALLANMEILAAIFEGRAADALRLVEEFRPFVEQEKYSPAEYGYHLLLLGQPEKAVYWLKQGIQGHDASMVSPEIVDLTVIAAHPLTRSLLDEPGLKELVEIRARNVRTAKAKP